MSSVRIPITPKPVRMREKVLVMLQERCKGDQCQLCVEFCPKHVLCLTDKYNRKGYHPVTACDIDACTNCDFCELICPDMAIFLVDRDEAEEAVKTGTVEEGTVVPELEVDSSKEGGTD
jgi:2-oxoglutarate ferredoxin oxidoreductase subunit delta